MVRRYERDQTIAFDRASGAVAVLVRTRFLNEGTVVQLGVQDVASTRRLQTSASHTHDAKELLVLASSLRFLGRTIPIEAPLEREPLAGIRCDAPSVIQIGRVDPQGSARSIFAEGVVDGVRERSWGLLRSPNPSHGSYSAVFLLGSSEATYVVDARNGDRSIYVAAARAPYVVDPTAIETPSSRPVEGSSAAIDGTGGRWRVCVAFPRATVQAEVLTKATIDMSWSHPQAAWAELDPAAESPSLDATTHAISVGRTADGLVAVIEARSW